MQTSTDNTKKPRRFFVAGAVVLVAFGWMFLAPTKLGGSVDYVITGGNSMEPLLHDGDLAIIRHSDDYEVGDVAAYQSPQMERVVLHRVEAIEDGRFVLKGDNNAWLDPELLGSNDMVGKLIWHIPAVGGWMGKLASPVPAAMIALGVTALAGALTRRRRTDDSPEVEVVPRAGFISSEMLASSARPALTAATVAFVAFAALGVTAFGRAGTVESTTDVSYEHRGRFGYSAPTEKSLASSGTEMGDGTPIFFKLSDVLNITFDYSFVSMGSSRVTGRARVLAQLQSDTGWSRTIAASPWAPIENGRARAHQRVDLAWLQRAVRQVREETGVTVGTYRLALTSEVRSSGEVAGGGFQDKFSSELAFQVDDTQLVPLGASIDRPLDALNTSEAATVSKPIVEPAMIDLLRFELPVTTGRGIAVAGGLLALLALAFFGLIYRRALNGSETSQIAALYGSNIVEIKPGQIEGALDVPSFDALVRLAGSQETLILHCNEDDHDCYFVLDQQPFRYRVKEPAARPEPEQSFEVMPQLRSVVFVEELGEVRTA